MIVHMRIHAAHTQHTRNIHAAYTQHTRKEAGEGKETKKVVRTKNNNDTNSSAEVSTPAHTPVRTPPRFVNEFEPRPVSNAAHDKNKQTHSQHI